VYDKIISLGLMGEVFYQINYISKEGGSNDATFGV
jgi:hypothetical protein